MGLPMFKAIARWVRHKARSGDNHSETETTVVVESSENTDSQLVPYDENLLERSRTQWQFGDWQSLAQLQRETLQQHPDRAKLALLAAAGHQQLGNMSAARQFTRLTQDWGCSKKLVSQILIAGVHTTLGRAAAIGGRPQQAAQHFESSLRIANGGDLNILAQKNSQAKFIQKEQLESNIKNSPCTSGNSKNTDIEKYQSSKNYWNGRYLNKGNSGAGSYGQLAEFKAREINKFISDKNITGLIDFGCGDGNQISMINVKRYTGLDVAEAAIDICKKKFTTDNSKEFSSIEEFLDDPKKEQLTISLDVIFHLTEEDIFSEYMSMLFNSSEKYCIIYASNEENLETKAPHVKGRNFTKWIDEHKPEWYLKSIIFNEHPYKKIKKNSESSFSDFYIYEKMEANTDHE
jgi:predicted house-cleaning noncanonical NTP pyrophosphatase (MazG superfamily)